MDNTVASVVMFLCLSLCCGGVGLFLMSAVALNRAMRWLGIREEDETNVFAPTVVDAAFRYKQ